MVHSSIHARTAFLFSSPGVLAWTIAAGGVGTHAHAARARVAFSAPLPSPRAIWLVGTSTESASTGVGTMPESSRRPAAGPTPGSRSAHFVGFPASQNVPEASRAAAGQGAEGSVPLVAQSCWSVFLNMSKTLDWSATSDRHRDMDGWLSLARSSVRPSESCSDYSTVGDQGTARECTLLHPKLEFDSAADLSVQQRQAVVDEERKLYYKVISRVPVQYRSRPFV